MILHYILDEHGEPVPCADVLTWARWFETADRTIACNTVADVRVSTVFLGLLATDNDPSHPGLDCLYETMVFAPEATLKLLAAHGNPEDRSIFSMVFGDVDIQRRYRTAAEARQGHLQIVGQVAAVLVRRN